MTNIVVVLIGACTFLYENVNKEYCLLSIDRFNCYQGQGEYSYSLLLSQTFFYNKSFYRATQTDDIVKYNTELLQNKIKQHIQQT